MVPSTNIGIAATNAPAKPLFREGIRCMKLSRGRRSNLGNETTAAGLSTVVAQVGVSVRPASAKGRDPLQNTPTASELQVSQCTAPSARLAEFKKFVVAKTNDKRQAVRSHLLRQEIEDQRCMHIRNEELPSRKRTGFLRLH